MQTVSCDCVCLVRHCCNAVPLCACAWQKPTINTARVFQVSIGALKGDLMILRGAAQRPLCCLCFDAFPENYDRSTDEARPTPLAITAGDSPGTALHGCTDVHRP